ncbi:hypothetical protein PINS_up010757 [Pythium insidiosum]|nr:hypothetical protein PINS_up010757 [Pythium insidiosum]
MGNALCTCTGRPDHEHDPGGRIARLEKALRKRALLDGGHELQTQSRTETDEEREARRHRAALCDDALGHARVPTAAAVASGAVDCETESDEYEYYCRQHGVTALPARRRMNAAMAEAFRTKLREPIMSPRSKMRLLVAQLDTGALNLRDNQRQGELVNDDDDESPRDKAAQPNRPRCDSALEDELGPALGIEYRQEDEEIVDDEDEYFEFVRIIVPPGPCGVVFQAPTDPMAPPTVDGFVRMYDGARGTIENSGLVTRGSVLCAINDLDVMRLPLADVIRALNLSSHLEREFVFRK